MLALANAPCVICVIVSDETKSVSKSVSMPASLWAAVEDFVPKVHHDRSSWIRMLVTKALGDANALPDDPVTQELNRARELIKKSGLETVKAKLDEIEEQALVVAGEPQP